MSPTSYRAAPPRTLMMPLRAARVNSRPLHRPPEKPARPTRNLSSAHGAGRTRGSSLILPDRAKLCAIQHIPKPVQPLESCINTAATRCAQNLHQRRCDAKLKQCKARGDPLLLSSALELCVSEATASPHAMPNVERCPPLGRAGIRRRAACHLDQRHWTRGRPRAHAPAASRPHRVRGSAGTAQTAR